MYKKTFSRTFMSHTFPSLPTLVLASGAMILLAFASTTLAASLYTITEVGTLGNTTAGIGINDIGDVTGNSILSSGYSHVYVKYNNGVITDLGNNSGVGFGINNSRQVVGYTVVADNVLHAFRTDINGSMVDLGTLGGNGSEAHAINNNGMVTGQSQIANGETHAFVTNANGTMTDLGKLGGLFSEGWAINSQGQVAGRTGIPSTDSQWHAFVTDVNGTMHDLGTLGGNASEAYGINDLGAVVGNSYVTGYDSAHTNAFVATIDGGMHDIGTPGEYSVAFDINNAGTIVGTSSRGAFVYDDASGMVYLSSLITNPSGWVNFFSASAINDNGQIVGSGSFDTGLLDIFGRPVLEMRAFILTPVPIPGAFWLFISGLLGFASVTLRGFKRSV